MAVTKCRRSRVYEPETKYVVALTTCNLTNWCRSSGLWYFWDLIPFLGWHQGVFWSPHWSTCFVVVLRKDSISVNVSWVSATSQLVQQTGSLLSICAFTLFRVKDGLKKFHEFGFFSETLEFPSPCSDAMHIKTRRWKPSHRYSVPPDKMNFTWSMWKERGGGV